LKAASLHHGDDVDGAAQLAVTAPAQAMSNMFAARCQHRLAELGRKSTTKRVTLGEHGATAPDEARRLARIQLGKVARGQDPSSDRATGRNAPTVDDDEATM
jgi:hypothetical protein